MVYIDILVMSDIDYPILESTLEVEFVQNFID